MQNKRRRKLAAQETEEEEKKQSQCGQQEVKDKCYRNKQSNRSDTWLIKSGGREFVEDPLLRSLKGTCRQISNSVTFVQSSSLNTEKKLVIRFIQKSCIS